MSVEVNNISNYSENGGPVISGIATVNTTGHIRVPNGTEAQRVGVESGSLRFNTDYNVVEFYNGTEWLGIYERDGVNINSRGVFGGGDAVPSPGAPTTTIDYVSIPTTGNAIDFGNLTAGRESLAAFSSSTRGVWGGGMVNAIIQNTIDYVTIASTGNALDFGDLTKSRSQLGGCSNSTRGLFAAGGNPNTTPQVFDNIIDYVTIATTGNATDFGDLSLSVRFPGACASSTRGVFAGGQVSIIYDEMWYVEIATTGNSILFGELTQAKTGTSGCSSPTRGIFGGGALPTITSEIDYITIASTGNALDFGDLISPRSMSGACSNSIRGVFGGGRTPSAPTILAEDTIEYVEIATQGGGFSFGGLSLSRRDLAACSNAHGGL